MSDRLFDGDAEPAAVVLSYGMGVDSTALLLRWLHEPASRDFELEQLIVLTAMTGDEFADTVRLVQTHIIRRLRDLRVRFVQVARSGPSQTDGITVLDDSRSPLQLYPRGPFALSDELRANGTVPQLATGQRRCTHHFKGFPLTTWTDRTFGGQPLRHVIGYNADEEFRAERCEGYATDERRAEFPLIAWQWGREKCEQYVAAIVGETWRKSCCTFCPFAGGKPDVLARYRQFPDAAAEALLLEYVSMAFNPRMNLYGRKSLRRVLEAHNNSAAIAEFEALLDSVPWGLFRVRRVVWAKGRADRKMEGLALGTRAEIAAGLVRDGGSWDGAHLRRWLRRRGAGFPTVEEVIVAAPAGAVDKSRGRFETNWEVMTGRLSLFDSEESSIEPEEPPT